MIHVRPYITADHAFILSLAPRLAIGIPPWRDSHKMTAAGQTAVTNQL